jgi:hypothetical protein
MRGYFICTGIDQFYVGVMGLRLKAREKRALPSQPRENKDSPMEKDSLIELDPKDKDITYKYRNPQVEAVSPKMRNLEPGSPEGYVVFCDSEPPNFR